MDGVQKKQDRKVFNLGSDPMSQVVLINYEENLDSRIGEGQL